MSISSQINNNGHSYQNKQQLVKFLLISVSLYLPLRRRVLLFVWTVVLDEAEAVAVFMTSMGLKHVSGGDKEASTSLLRFVVM